MTAASRGSVPEDRSEITEGRGIMSPLLFAYGTLMPADREAAARDGWLPDAVRGRLFDLGPHPALIDLDDPDAGWVEGFVRPTDLQELRSRLDPWEEVERGLYRRAGTISRAGLPVWVYVYNRPLPPGARGPLDRWDGPSRFRRSDFSPTPSDPRRAEAGRTDDPRRAEAGLTRGGA